MVGESITPANARRLAACWNACEGLSTEALENITMVGDTLAGRFAATHQGLIKAAAGILRLETQRDELLAALIAITDRYASDMEGVEHMRPEIAGARTAITRATEP